MDLIRMLIDFFLKLFGARKDAPDEEAAPARLSAGDAPRRGAPVVADLAGFDPVNDEDAFFEAHLVMESEGAIAHGGAVDEVRRAEIMRRFGIRDRTHWYAVKEACSAILHQKHGSGEVVLQRMMNLRSKLSESAVQASEQAVRSQGGFEPVKGIGLEQWAAFNAAITGGMNIDDLLKGACIDRARWDVASAEWMARMERDATFAITRCYGEAFQNASKSKYASFAKEANEARRAGRDVTMAPPVDFETYLRIAHEQACYTAMGKSPTDLLAAQGMTIADWCDLATFMAYYVARNWGAKSVEYTAVIRRIEQDFYVKYPGVTPDLDIAF